jgi:hypothetical protein
VTAHEPAEPVPPAGGFLARGAGLGVLAGAASGALGLGIGAALLAAIELARGGRFDARGVLVAAGLATIVGAVLGLFAGIALAGSLLDTRPEGPTRRVRRRAAFTAAGLGLLAAVFVLLQLLGIDEAVGGTGELGWQWLWVLPYPGLAAAAGWWLSPRLWPRSARSTPP